VIGWLQTGQLHKGAFIAYAAFLQMKSTEAMPINLSKHALPVALAMLFAGPLAAAPVGGESVAFSSPGGLTEQCIRIQPLPGADFSKHDRETEADYCALDLYRLALCPKLWSTSPGTILYEIDPADWNDDPAGFEQAHCAGGHHARGEALGKPATFKMSVNGRETSATYAPSSWVYYHFSRYLDTGVHVPVAVYRSMEAAQHNRRVTRRGVELTQGHRNLRMLAAGWRFVDELERGEGSAGARQAALTDEDRQVFGVLLDNKGDRYGPEINGTRESGWGSGQNHDFQLTAPFIALRTPGTLEEAVRVGVRQARSNPRMAKALPADVSTAQVVFWMRDVLEIVLLDYILGQQDRIGNIDYDWRWYWVENGRLESKSAHGHEAPEQIRAFEPVRLKRSAINDNDAGVRSGYANFARKTGMLDALRHFHPGLYQRLGRLAADLSAGGPAYAWLTGPAGLGAREADAIAQRAAEAFEKLSADCRAGQLALDLDPAAFLGAEPDPSPRNCEIARP
jgi:hypothetical protein